MKSDSINELAGALAKAQGAMDLAKKGAENPFFKSSYSTLADSWDSCRAPLSMNGLSIVQTVQHAEGKQELVTTLMHSSGQWIESRYPLIPVKNDPQSMGSCVTYARRYCLNAIVGICSDEEEDDGNAAMGFSKPPVKKPAPLAIPPIQSHAPDSPMGKAIAEMEKPEAPRPDPVRIQALGVLNKMLNEKRITEEEVKDYVKRQFQTDSLKTLATAQVTQILRWIEEISSKAFEENLRQTIK